MRQLKTLKLKETSANIVEINRIELSAFDLAKEMVERIITSLASFEIVSCLRCSAIIGNWAISWMSTGLERELADDFTTLQDSTLPEDAVDSIGWDDAGLRNRRDLT